MEHQRGSIQFAAGGQPVKVEVRRTFIKTVRVADADRQGVAVHLSAEALYFAHIHQIQVIVGHSVLYTADGAQLTFHGNAYCMGAADHGQTLPHIFLKGMMGTIIHHGGKAGSQAHHSLLIADAMVQMQNDRHLAVIGSPLNGICQIPEVSGVDGTLTDTENDGIILGVGGLHNGFDPSNVINIEVGNSGSPLIRNFQNFFQCSKHVILSFRADLKISA